MVCDISNLSPNFGGNWFSAEENTEWVEFEVPTEGDKVSSYAVMYGATAFHT